MDEKRAAEGEQEAEIDMSGIEERTVIGNPEAHPLQGGEHFGGDHADDNECGSYAQSGHQRGQCEGSQVPEKQVKPTCTP